MLALALGKSLAEIEQLSAREINDWQWFYSQQPFDDFHRYHRPAALIAQSIGGGEIDTRLKWLQYYPTADYSGFDEAAQNTMKAFGITPPVRG